MGAKEIDKIFRQKLQSQASPLPVQGWELLEERMNQKPKIGFMWWRVAAVFVLFFGAVMSIYLWRMDIGTDINEVNELAMVSFEQSESVCEHENNFPVPALQELSSKNKVDIKPVVDKEKVNNKKPNHVLKAGVEKVNSKRIDRTINVEVMDESMPSITEVKEDEKIQQHENEAKQKKPLRIRITYKRGNKKVNNQFDEMVVKQEADTSVNKLMNMLASAREIKPGNLMADLRDAKQGFFDRSASIRNNNVKTLNK